MPLSLATEFFILTIVFFPHTLGPLPHPQALSGEVSPFMCSGAHVTQIDSHPSPVGAFLEGALLCKPQPPVRSCVLQVLSLLPPCPLSPLPLRSVRTFLSFALLTPVAKVGVPLSRTLSTALMHTHEAGDTCAQNDKKGVPRNPRNPP